MTTTLFSTMEPEIQDSTHYRFADQDDCREMLAMRTLTGTERGDLEGQCTEARYNQIRQNHISEMK